MSMCVPSRSALYTGLSPSATARPGTIRPAAAASPAAADEHAV